MTGEKNAPPTAVRKGKAKEFISRTEFEHHYRGMFVDPAFRKADAKINELLATRAAVEAARSRHADSSTLSRVLLICASARNDKTCPGEMSKSFRLMQTAKDTLEKQQLEVDVLDLSEPTSEYKKVIYPCKACVSTPMPLCHCPC
jgi:hypothetical protein